MGERGGDVQMIESEKRTRQMRRLNFIESRKVEKTMWKIISHQIGDLHNFWWAVER